MRFLFGHSGKDCTKFVLYVLCFFLAVNKSDAAKPYLRRICTDQTDIFLNWDLYGDTCNGVDKIYIWGKPNAISSFQKVDSVMQGSINKFTQKGAFSVWKNGTYYIEYILNGCVKAASNTMQIDFTPPGKIVLESISVEGGKITVSWQKDASKDIKGYTIYYHDAGGYHPIKTINNGKTTVFTDEDNTIDPNTSVASYTVAAIDSCDNLGLIGDEHTSIYLSSYADTCNRIVQLKWDSYKGWQSARYDVFVQEPGASVFRKFYSETTISNSYQSVFSTKKNGLYYFYVSAFSQDGKYSSSSNVVKVQQTTTPDFKIEFTGITYLYSSNAVKLLFYINKPMKIKKVNIAAGSDSNNMAIIGTININSSSKLYEFTVAYNVNNAADYYKLSAIDNCDLQIQSSKSAKLINVKCMSEETGRTINWGEFKGWGNPASEYEIYRSVFPNQNSSWESLTKVTAKPYKSEDKDTNLLVYNDGICYKVIARKSAVDTLAETEVESDISCCYGKAVLLFPNAFYPKGINNVFKPVYLFVDSTSYKMEIYNRWGEQVFSTTDLNKGWDGMNKKGTTEPQDIYIYIAKYKDYYQNEHFRKGFITLLK